jgi:hypothetical protein
MLRLAGQRVTGVEYSAQTLLIIVTHFEVVFVPEMRGVNLDFREIVNRP